VLLPLASFLLALLALLPLFLIDAFYALAIIIEVSAFGALSLSIILIGAHGALAPSIAIMSRVP